MFFEVGIPNLVCKCILGWRSVAYHFRVNVISDRVLRIIVTIFFEVGFPKNF